MEDKNLQTKRRLFIAGAVIAFVVVIVLLQLASGAPKPSEGNNSASETSKNTFTNGAVNESTASSPIEGVNFDELTEVGMKVGDIDSLQYSLYQYAQPKGVSVRNATAVKGSIKQTLPSGNISYFAYTFDVKLDDKNTVKVELRTTGPYRDQVFLSDQSGNKLYDSGVLDVRNF